MWDPFVRSFNRTTKERKSVPLMWKESLEFPFASILSKKELTCQLKSWHDQIHSTLFHSKHQRIQHQFVDFFTDCSSICCSDDLSWRKWERIRWLTKRFDQQRQMNTVSDEAQVSCRRSDERLVKIDIDQTGQVNLISLIGQEKQVERKVCH